ncbi:hypothetical protein [Kangiella sp. M94]
MIKDFVIQALLALLVGAGVFYIVAPYSWGLGIVYNQLIYIVISLGISLAILIPLIFLLFKKKRKHFFSLLFFSFIGTLVVSFLYPPHDRYLHPSDSLKEDIEVSLHKAGMPPGLGFDVRNRKKVAYDLFAEHRWEVKVIGSGYRNYKYFYYVERFGQGKLIISDKVDWSELTSKPQ